MKHEIKRKRKGAFDSIKISKEYKYLYKKEKKIRIDFHGNRDFYNWIKGIAIEFGKSGDSENNKAEIIIKFIERHF